MRRVLCVLHCLLAFTSFAYPQNSDNAKIRQSIEMPALSTSYGVHYKSSERDSKGNKFELTQKIADLQKKLTGAPDDAQVYLDLRAAYVERAKDQRKAIELEQSIRDQKDAKELERLQAQWKAHDLERAQDTKTAQEMLAKAENILRPHVQTTDPQLGHLLPLYATTLEYLKDNPWQDCEAWARRAVSVAPQDWRTWTYLAHARLQQIPTVLCGGDDKHLSKDRRTQEVIGALHLKRFQAEHVDAAEKVLNEALQCHDKAKQLAPNEPKRQEQRYGFRLTEIVLRNGIAAFRGQKAPYPFMQLDRELLNELQASAKLYPDHLLWQSQLAHQLIVLGWQGNAPKSHEAMKTFTPARPDDLPAIREALANIEKLTVGASSETTIYCCSMLAALSASMMDHAATERLARRILQLDPKHQIASEQLQSSLTFQKRHAEVLQAAQTLNAQIPSARNCYLLAKALVLNERYDLAQNACLAGLKLEATDVYCLLGTAALVMRKGDDAKSLDFAAELLDRARRECRPNGSVDLFAEHDYLAAVHQALSGNTAFARIKLQRLQSESPDNPRYDKILAVIGR
jgi:tetratricopeptide (TPR) repeat protein